MADIDTSIYEESSLTEEATVAVDFNPSRYETVAIAESATVVTETFIRLDSRATHALKSPVAIGESSFGEFMSVDEKVPFVSGEGAFGGFAEGEAPVAFGEAVFIHEEFLSLIKPAPLAVGEGRFGAHLFEVAPVPYSEASLYQSSLSVDALTCGARLEATFLEIGYILLSGFSSGSFLEAAFQDDRSLSLAALAPGWYGSGSLMETPIILVTSAIAPTAFLEATLLDTSLSLAQVVPCAVMFKKGILYSEAVYNEAFVLSYER